MPPARDGTTGPCGERESYAGDSGDDPADDEYPDKPKRMRWTTYNRLMDRLVAADGVADEQLVLLAARGLGR